MTELWQFSNTQQPVRFNPWYKVKIKMYSHIYIVYISMIPTFYPVYCKGCLNLSIQRLMRTENIGWPHSGG